MDPYKEMYYTLFNKITDMITELQEVQLQTEEMFLAQKDQPKLSKLPASGKERDRS